MRLLFAEDDVKLAAAVARGLRHEGYAVDVAADGDEALWFAREWQYAAMIFDVMLPGRSGLEITRTLRDEGTWTPVLLLTARGEVGDRVRGLDAGADDYLTKPFDFEELLARLRALLRRTPTARPVALSVGALVLEPSACTVTLAGHPLELTLREHAVLEVLMRGAGQLVSRRQIVEAVWDADFDGGSNVVDVYVSRLRRKLGNPALIRTVRGQGFALAHPP